MFLDTHSIHFLTSHLLVCVCVCSSVCVSVCDCDVLQSRTTTTAIDAMMYVADESLLVPPAPIPPQPASFGLPFGIANDHEQL